MILTTLGLLLTSGGLGTAFARWQANKELKEAYAKLETAAWWYDRERLRWQENAAELIAERACFQLWLIPRARHAHQSIVGWDGEVRPLGGRTRQQVADLMNRAQAMFIGPKGTVDLTLLMSSGGALAIQGIEHLDQAHVLHQTVGDVVGHLPVPGASDLAHGLGSAAGIAITDVLSSALLVLSVIRIGANLRGIAEAGEAADEVRGRTSRVNQAASTMGDWCERAAGITTETSDASYELFKWTWVAEQLAADRRDAGGWRQRLMRKIQTSFDRFSDIQARAVVDLA